MPTEDPGPGLDVTAREYAGGQKVFGRYTLRKILGRGGMGIVWLARDEELEREVALKFLPDLVVLDQALLGDLKRETRRSLELTHKNIVRIHDFVHDERAGAISMEYIDGDTLSNLRAEKEQKVFQPEEIATWTAQLCDALDYAHNHVRIVHRDLKPANLMVNQKGDLKVSDFGIARSLGDSMSKLTMASGTSGTLVYMSPQQLDGERGTHLDDVYSLGATLFDLLTSKPPFYSGNVDRQIHERAAPSMTERRKEFNIEPAFVSPVWEETVAACLAKDPARRPQSATEVAQRLQLSAPQPSRVATVGKSTPQRKALLFGAAAALVLLLAGAYFGLGKRAPLPAPPPAPPSQSSADKSIAVLPFENLGAAEHAYFAAGVTEEVTLQLAKLRSLRVMSRNAVARFESGAAALPAMTRELGVGAVLTGTVRYSGQQVRVGVQLLAAPSGETLWGEQYDRTLANIFDVQSDIALRVARALQASLAPEERARIERAPTDNAEAYQLFLQQREFKFQPPERNAEGIALLQKAIALDPRFALAHATLAHRFVFRGDVTGREDYLLGLETARTAVALDPQLSRAHYSLGLSLSAAGFPDESRLAMQRAIELDPNQRSAMTDLSMIELSAGRLDQAFYWAKRAFPLAPNLPNSHAHLALPLILLDGEVAERFLAASARRFQPDEPGGGMRIVILRAMLDLHRGDAAAGLDRLRHAVAAVPAEFEGRLALMEFAVYAGAADAHQLVDAALQTSAETRVFYGPYTTRIFRAFLWLGAGEPDRARPLIDEAMAAASAAIENGDRGVDPHYQHTALHLMRGDREAALAAFERAIDAGMRDPQLPRRDPLLAPLGTEPRFIAAMERVDRDIAAMRQRVDFREVEEWASSVSGLK